MLIRCPNCNTNYKVSEEILKGTAAVFRCSRCKHTFEPEPAELAQKPVRGKDRTESKDEGDLSFSFAPNENPQGKPKLGDDAAQTRASPDTGKPGPERSETAEQWALTVPDPTHEEAFTISAAAPNAAEEKNIDERKEPTAQEFSHQASPSPRDLSDNVLAFDSYRDQQASTSPYLTLLGLLIIFFLLITALHHAHPTPSEKIVKKIPLVGAWVLQNNHLKNGIALQSLRASYQTIQGNREVFVVTGMAQNQNPAVIREVRVSGRLYDHDDKGVEQQTIWLGNAISAKIIRGMTVQDIADLQRLAPLRSFGIPPGDSVPFAIVFMKGTKGIKNFTCEILSAEGEV